LSDGCMITMTLSGYDNPQRASAIVSSSAASLSASMPPPTVSADDEYDAAALSPIAGLPVVDEAGLMLNCCADWNFAVELLTDTANERKERIERLNDSRLRVDPRALYYAVEGFREVACNLYLTAMADVTSKLLLISHILTRRRDRLGDVGDITIVDGGLLLQLRDRLIRQFEREYERLVDYLPTAQRRADEAALQLVEEQMVADSEDAYVRLPPAQEFRTM